MQCPFKARILSVEHLQSRPSRDSEVDKPSKKASARRGTRVPESKTVRYRDPFPLPLNVFGTVAQSLIENLTSSII
jgi:hypothetical protein